jgi:alkanesulfonate monooxygenase SsuD/methylene tetrahydromethanopterin reductase-like flavin-dependent oxidoreductase (luciferase family)
LRVGWRDEHPVPDQIPPAASWFSIIREPPFCSRDKLSIGPFPCQFNWPVPVQEVVHPLRWPRIPPGERQDTMDVGVGLDATLGLSFDQHRALAREAARLGYTSLWTPAGLAQDAFQICAQWWMASREIVPGGLFTGISVVPVPLWTPVQLAASAGTVGELTGGRFILGIGSGGVHEPGYRRRLGLPDIAPLPLMRDYLLTVRRLLAGEAVDYVGAAVTLHGARLGFQPPPVPVYLGALGPRMLDLAGEAADGVLLNWCSPSQVAWSRQIVAEGARRAGRDPSAVRIAEYIRVCVDEDVEAARRALTRAVLGYALARPGTDKRLGYRGHFARMGFDQVLRDLEERRDRGASEAELIEAFPPELLRQIGYYGPAAGAREAFRTLAAGLDLAIVRVVAARSGYASALAAMHACAGA